MSGSWDAIDEQVLPGLLADLLHERSDAQRVAVDGPPCAGPDIFAEALVEPLRALGRPAAHIRADRFWRDASLRLEYGRRDVESYLSWLDEAALRRETLEPFGAGRAYLTSLRDPRTDRSTREPARAFAPGTVLLVSGTFLLSGALPFDRSVHLYLPAAARARRTPPEQAWTLPAYEHYEAQVRPVDTAEVAVRLDRQTPAVRGLRTRS